MRYLFMASLVFLAGCQGSSNKGNEGPSGGDIVAQQAATLVSEVVTLVEANSTDFPEVDIANLKAAAQRVKIIIRDRTYANGVETDATNNGSDQIDINGARWPSIKDQDRRMALIFHELLGLIGLEKNTYSISSRLLMADHRFDKEQTVTCLQQSRSCQVKLRYDRTQKALLVEDLGCGGFQRMLNFFYKHERKFYSWDKPCVDPDAPAPVPAPQPGTPGPNQIEQPCKQSSAQWERWSSIRFLDGGRFFFEGGFRDGPAQLVCAP